jgi:hypothetical protein
VTDRKRLRRGDTLHRRARRRVAHLLPISATIVIFIGAGFSHVPAGAAGILPPANPSANIAPNPANWLASIDAARAREGVGTMNISQSALATLPLPEQVFAVENVERVDRGLPPIEDMTAQLDSYAQVGVDSGTDPPLPSSLTGGAPITYGGSFWVGVPSALAADYYLMYDDGYGGTATTNSGCSLATPSGCWIHRDIILHDFGGCPTGSPALSMGAAYRSGTIGAVVVASCGPASGVTATWNQVAALVTTRTIGIASLANGTGYWEAQANGTVGAFGSAHNFGSLTAPLNAPIVGITPTPDGKGYWLVAADGGIFSRGDAVFYGSTGSLHLNQPIVGMSSTPDGKGYWLVAADGGIFSYGDAAFHGSMGGSRLNQPVVGMAGDPATGGYWEVAADGGVFSWDAPFYGSTGSIHLNQPVVGLEVSPNGKGYRFVASDGGIFNYGQATFDGSTGAIRLASPVVGMAPDNATNGYWMAAADGGIFSFGGAAYMGRLNSSAG